MTVPDDLVSIGVPTYNRLESLKLTVESLLRQTHPHLEIVISDNASTDGTEAWAEALALEHESVTYLRSPVNVGPTENFERARSATNGPWFMWLADDDWIDDDYIATCLAHLRADPKRALVAGTAHYFADGHPDEIGVVVQATGATAGSRVVDYYRQVFDNGTFYGVMHRSTIDATHPPREQMGDDWLLLAEIATVGEIHTLTTTSVHRAVRPSRTFAQLAQGAGFSRWQGRFPYVAIALFAMRDAASGSAAFRRLGWRRFPIALHVGAVIARRFILSGLRWTSLKRRAGRIADRVGNRSSSGAGTDR